MIIRLKLEQFDVVSICTQLQNFSATLSAHGDDENAAECRALRDKLRRQMQEQAQEVAHA